jgi:DNA-binding LacI/PurR family transcriptional regulator
VVELVVISRLGLGWMEEQAPVYASVFDGIEEALTAAGCELVVRQIERWPASFPANDPPMAGRIFFGADDTRTRPSGFPLAPPSIWLMGSPPAWFAGDIIHIDHMAVGQLAAQEAIRLGHRSCVYLGTALGSPSARLGYRADAFLHHLQALGGQAQMIIDPSLIDMTRTANCASVERIRAALAPLLRRPSRPSAICVQADMLTPAVYQCLSDVGLRPQRDVTVISCNNEARYLRSLKPPPIVIDVQAVQVGKQAVDTLLWRIGHPAAPALHLAIRPVLAP